MSLAKDSEHQFCEQIGGKRHKSHTKSVSSSYWQAHWSCGTSCQCSPLAKLGVCACIYVCVCVFSLHIALIRGSVWDNGLCQWEWSGCAHPELDSTTKRSSCQAFGLTPDPLSFQKSCITSVFFLDTSCVMFYKKNNKKKITCTVVDFSIHLLSCVSFF